MKSLKSLILPLSILSFLCASFSANAQQYLYLKKKGEVPAFRWEQGAPIELKVRNGDEEYWLTGNFVRADSSRIIFGTKMIRKEDIVAIKMDRGLMPFFGKATMAGAALFPGIIIFNAVINGDRPIIRPLTVYLSLGALATGFALDYFGTRYFYYKDGWYLENIDFNDD